MSDHYDDGRPVDVRPKGLSYRGLGRWFGLGRSRPEFERTHPEAEISREEREAALKHLADAETAENESETLIPVLGEDLAVDGDPAAAGHMMPPQRAGTSLSTTAH